MNPKLKEINDMIPYNIRVKLKDMLVKLEDSVITETPLAPEVEAPTIVEVKTKEGLTFQVDKLEVGGMIKQVTDAGVVDVLDGSYELESGEVLAVVGGAISEIKPVEVAPTEVAPEMTANPDVETLKSTVAALNEMVAKMSVQIAEQKETIKLTLSAVNSIIEQPAAEPVAKPFGFKNKQLENLLKIKK
jgi:hypothetical protein